MIDKGLERLHTVIAYALLLTLTAAALTPFVALAVVIVQTVGAML